MNNQAGIASYRQETKLLREDTVGDVDIGEVERGKSSQGSRSLILQEKSSSYISFIRGGKDLYH